MAYLKIVDHPASMVRYIDIYLSERQFKHRIPLSTLYNQFLRVMSFGRDSKLNYGDILKIAQFVSLQQICLKVNW